MYASRAFSLGRPRTFTSTRSSPSAMRFPASSAPRASATVRFLKLSRASCAWKYNWSACPLTVMVLMRLPLA